MDLIANFNRYQKLARLSPFQRWELSECKEEIVVNLEYGMEESDRLGVISMDLDAPCDIARQYIERKFRHQLNEHCGSSFSFYIRQQKEEGGEEIMLPSEQEEVKWIRDFVVHMKEKGEQEQEGEEKEYLMVTIVVNAGEEKVHIEEIFDDEVDPLLGEEFGGKKDENEDDGYHDF
jgi:hypothetical protein